MGLVVLVWAAMSITSLSLGVALAKVLRQRTHDESIPYFWVGLCLLVAWVQLWNFFLPISWLTLLTAFLASVLISRTSLVEAVRLRLALATRNRWATLGMVLFGLWVANRCIGPNLYSDAGIYHTNQILWATQHPVITGVANLNLLLASNTSCLLVAAMIDAGPLHLHSMMIFNGLLIVVTMCQAIQLVGNAGVNNFAKYILLVLPCGLFEFAGTSYLAATDFAAGILVLHSLPMIVSIFFKQNTSGSGDARDYFIAVLMLTTSFCLKQTTIMFSAIILIALTSILIARYRSTPWFLAGTLGSTFIVSAVVLLPWLLRSIMICGYPVYSPYLGLPVEWRVPRGVVERHSREFTFLSQYGLVNIPTTVSSLEWHRQIMVNFLTKGRAMFVIPLAFALAAIIPVVLRKQGRIRLQYGFWWLALCFVISFVGWIEIATHLRYGYFIMYGMAGILCAILIDSVEDYRRKQWLKRGIFGVSLALGIALIGSRFLSANQTMAGPTGIPIDRPFIKPGSDWGFHPDKIQEATGVINETASGLKVLTFEYGLIWDAPLPNTIFFNKHLQLVVPGDLRSGFRLVPWPGDASQSWGDRNYLMEPSLELLEKKKQ